MADPNETPGHRAGEIGRDRGRSNCLALSTTGADRICTGMYGGQRRALEWGFSSGGLSQPTSGGAAVFVAADWWSRIAVAADIAGGEIML